MAVTPFSTCFAFLMLTFQKEPSLLSCLTCAPSGEIVEMANTIYPIIILYHDLTMRSITTLRQHHLYRKNYIAIGNTLLKHPHFQMSMPYFPLLRTVHATFIAHGAPSVTYHRLEAIAPALITSAIITSTSTFLHRFNCLLFFVSLHLLMLDTFPRSNNPIRHIYL